MKCLVFSDSHRAGERKIARVLAFHPDAQVIFFLGDGLSDLENFVSCESTRTWIAVRGNCDFSDTLGGVPVLKTEEITLNKCKILLTHGDLYGAKYGLAGLRALAVERAADVVLFGHTHVPVQSWESVGNKRVGFFNPGSIGAPGGEATFGILTVCQNGVLFSTGAADAIPH